MLKYKVLFLLIISFNLFSQKLERPKIVVSIVVDMMRFDDLYKYYDYYGEGGFRELLKSGSVFNYAHYNYEPTTTAPGHASIFTGSIPYFHGIIANDFFDKSSEKVVNCVEDKNYQSVGSGDEIGKCSPKRLLASTIADQIRLFSELRSKAFAISIKNRGAILPGGHIANGAFWYNNKTGDFITSSYYMNDLPLWIKKFNERKLVQDYMKKGWDLFLDKDSYSSSPAYNGEIPPDIFKSSQNSFPYTFNHLTNEEKNNLFQFTPYSNQILVEFAKDLIENENLGQNSFPDFLSVSFSSTDIIGHAWGNFSKESMDVFIRLDRNLAELISYLNRKFGQNNYPLFLTSDHGAIETPSFLKKVNSLTSELKTKQFYDSLKSFAINKFGSEKIILNFSNRQIYLDRDYINDHNLEFEDVEDSFVNYIRDNFDAIQSIMTRSDL